MFIFAQIMALTQDNPSRPKLHVRPRPRPKVVNGLKHNARSWGRWGLVRVFVRGWLIACTNVFTIYVTWWRIEGRSHTALPIQKCVNLSRRFDSWWLIFYILRISVRDWLVAQQCAYIEWSKSFRRNIHRNSRNTIVVNDPAVVWRSLSKEAPRKSACNLYF